MSKKIIIFRIFIFIFLVFYLYYYISNDFFIDEIIYDLNKRYNDVSIKDLIVSESIKSINKIVSYNDIKEINTEINYENDNKEAIVYIYNTHDEEKYFLPFTNDYSVIPTVKTASFILKDHLNNLGINSYVETRSIKTYLNKYKLDYTGSYEASRYYLVDKNKKYNFKYFIDIHRDSIKRSASLYEKDGKNYARILFVVSMKHKNYKKNLEFVNYLNKRIENKYKGLSRGLYKRSDVIFNQDVSPRAILIEVGGVDNTIDEINNTLEVIAQVINEYNGE